MSKMHYTNPTAFATSISCQTAVINNTYVISNLNITKSAYYYLTDFICAIPGVMDIVRTTHTKSHG
jgi:hypothetical protein